MIICEKRRNMKFVTIGGDAVGMTVAEFSQVDPVYTPPFSPV